MAAHHPQRVRPQLKQAYRDVRVLTRQNATDGFAFILPSAAAGRRLTSPFERRAVVDLAHAMRVEATGLPALPGLHGPMTGRPAFAPDAGFVRRGRRGRTSDGRP